MDIFYDVCKSLTLQLSEQDVDLWQERSLMVWLVVRLILHGGPINRDENGLTKQIRKIFLITFWEPLM